MDDRTSGRRTVPSRSVDRRRFLTVSGASIALLAGCADAGPDGSDDSSAADPEPADDSNGQTGDGNGETDESDGDEAGENSSDDGDDGDEPDGEGDTEGGDGGDESDNEDENHALEHPSATNMAHSPVLGPDSLDDGAVIIMFDDPSCPACAYFEQEIFPDLESHIDGGELTVVWRGIAAIEEWSEATLQVLWATYERDVETFWDLRNHLFEVQESINSSEDGITEAVAYLESDSSLDAEGIRSDAENGEFSARIEHDGDAASRAGLDATPYFYLFRDGEFRTEVRGAEDYRVFESALEL